MFVPSSKKQQTASSRQHRAKQCDKRLKRPQNLIQNKTVSSWASCQKCPLVAAIVQYDAMYVSSECYDSLRASLRAYVC